MGVLQIIGDRPGAGKTCLAAAFLIRALEQGKKVGYYKPFSHSPDGDSDVNFVSRHVLSSANGADAPRPYPVPEGTGQGIAAAAARLAAANDLVMVEGPDLYTSQGEGSPLTGQPATLGNSRVVLLFRYTKGLDTASIATAAEPLRQRLAGVIINGVTVYRRREVSQGLLESLRARNLPVWGALPEDRAMLSVTVQQIADYLGGTWAQEPVNTDACIDRLLIGANIMDAGPNYFGRFEHQAVITRGGRPDIQMASLAQDTRCLILTGGVEPIDYVKAEARQREVPMVLVQQDTLTTAEALAGLLRQSKIDSRRKVERFAELVRQNLDLGALDSALR